jgi:hypothetical protein
LHCKMLKAWWNGTNFVYTAVFWLMSQEEEEEQEEQQQQSK